MPHDLRHFDHLADLLRLEQQEEHRRLAALRETLSPAERAERGIALLDMVLVDEGYGLGGRILLDLAHDDGSALQGRVGIGDLVELRPRRAEVLEPARGVVARKGRARITVAFEQPPPDFVRDGRLLVDLMPNDVSFERARNALAQVRDQDRDGARRRREVLLGRSAPTFLPEHSLAQSVGEALNTEQREAARRALLAEDFFLVHGPPGTGKSTVLAEVAVQAVAAGARVLASAPSNAAVDHLLELCLARGLTAVRVGHPARVAERLFEHTLDAQVESHPDRIASRDLLEEAFELQGYARKQRDRGRSRERFANARDAGARARALFAEARALEKRAVQAVLGRASVVCATCTSLPGSDLEGQRFDLALLDEATQATEPVALLTFLAAPRVVLAGDHLQLPPTVTSREAAAGGLGRSLFERLLDEHGEDVRKMLREQYRMHADIMAFPSARMYGGALRAHPSVAARTLAPVLREGTTLDAPPVLFLDTAGKGFDDEVPAGSESHRNPGEAELVLSRARALLAAGLPPDEIAVIAPYSAQVALLRERAQTLGVDPGVEIDTVDAFQGREKDAVLLTMTRANDRGEVGFLGDLRRMNVAITRARRHLFAVGDAGTLAQHEFYRAFIEYVQSRDGYRTAWDWPEGEAT